MHDDWNESHSRLVRVTTLVILVLSALGGGDLTTAGNIKPLPLIATVVSALAIVLGLAALRLIMHNALIKGFALGLACILLTITSIYIWHQARRIGPGKR